MGSSRLTTPLRAPSTRDLPSERPSDRQVRWVPSYISPISRTAWWKCLIRIFFNLIRLPIQIGPPLFAPFNVAVIGGKVYVAFAAKNPATGEEVRGGGFVSVFDTDGNLIQRITGPFSAPWGMALAPQNFGELGEKLLIGNFGNGTIKAFDPRLGAREFRLDSSKDDYERGSIREYIMGLGPLEPNIPPPQIRVLNGPRNDPRFGLPIERLNLSKTPVYIRF
jgi:hypothetical protein